MGKRNSFYAVFKSMILLSAAIASGAWAELGNNFSGGIILPYEVNPTGRANSDFDVGHPPVDYSACVTSLCLPSDRRPYANKIFIYGNDAGIVRSAIDVGDYDPERVGPSFRTQLLWQRQYQIPDSPPTFEITGDYVEIYAPENTNFLASPVPYAYTYFDVSIYDLETGIFYPDEFYIQADGWGGLNASGYSAHAYGNGFYRHFGRSGDSVVKPVIWENGLIITAALPMPFRGDIDLSMIEGDSFILRYILRTHVEISDGDNYARAYISDPLGIEWSDPPVPISSQTTLRICDEAFDDSRYRINGDGTVTDLRTALQWQRCPSGFLLADQGTPDLSDDRCEPDANVTPERAWQQALTDAEADSFAGHDDWRLPNIKELESLVAQCSMPTIEPAVFPDTPIQPGFWSSTAVAAPGSQPDRIWQVTFFNGDIGSSAATDSAFLRLVRNSGDTPLAPLPALYAERSAVLEGDSGDTELLMPVTLSRPADSVVTVDYEVVSPNAHATDGVDFDSTAGSLSFAPGETRKDVRVTIHGDTEVEKREYLHLKLSNPSANSRIGKRVGLGTIIDDEPWIRFARRSTHTPEGNSGENRSLRVPILLDKPAAAPVTVEYRLENDTADTGVDIENATGTVTFAAGERLQHVELATIGDNTPENDEAILLVLSNPVGGRLVGGEISQRVFLIDDDAYAGTYAALNDTGVVDCATPDAALLDCPQAGFPGQDGETGRDADPATNSDADGSAGFSFVKLAMDGTPLANQLGSYSTDPWACVEDNVTGLTWEVKAPDDPNPGAVNGLHSARWTYSWFNSSGIDDGGFAGIENGGSCVDGTNCDTEKFVAAVNAEALCGYTDWRLPTIEELYTILNLGSFYHEFDFQFFPHQLASRTWSSSTAVQPRTVENPGSGKFAWALTSTGMLAWDKGNDNPLAASGVRLVRGGSQ